MFRTLPVNTGSLKIQWLKKLAAVWQRPSPSTRYTLLRLLTAKQYNLSNWCTLHIITDSLLAHIIISLSLLSSTPLALQCRTIYIHWFDTIPICLKLNLPSSSDQRKPRLSNVLHILSVANHNKAIYKFIPFLTHFNSSSNISVPANVGQINLIAVGHSKAYQILSSSDLQNCPKMVESLFCKGRNVLLGPML